MLQRRIRGGSSTEGRREICWRGAWGSAFSESPPAPAGTSFANPLVVPYFSQNDTPAAPATASAFFLELRHARRYGARSAAIRLQRPSRASTATAPRPRPSSQPCVRSGLEGQLFHHGVTAGSDSRDRRGRPSAPGWLPKAPLQRIWQRHWTAGDRLRSERPGFTNDPQAVRAISRRGGATQATSTARAHYSAQNWIPLEAKAAAAAGFLVL